MPVQLSRKTRKVLQVVLFPLGWLMMIAAILLAIMTIGVVYKWLVEGQPFDWRIVQSDLIWLGVFFVATKVGNWLDL